MGALDLTVLRALPSTLISDQLFFTSPSLSETGMWHSVNGTHICECRLPAEEKPQTGFCKCSVSAHQHHCLPREAVAFSLLVSHKSFRVRDGEYRDLKAGNDQILGQ